MWLEFAIDRNDVLGFMLVLSLFPGQAEHLRSSSQKKGPPYKRRRLTETQRRMRQYLLCLPPDVYANQTAIVDICNEYETYHHADPNTAELKLRHLMQTQHPYDIDGETWLTRAIRHWNWTMVRTILKIDASQLEARNLDGTTAYTYVPDHVCVRESGLCRSTAPSSPQQTLAEEVQSHLLELCPPHPTSPFTPTNIVWF